MNASISVVRAGRQPAAAQRGVMAISDSIGVVTEVFLAVGPALKLAMIALAVVVSPAALPLDDLSSWEPGEPIVLAAFVLLATGGAVVQYSLPAPERIVRERSAGDHREAA